MRYTSLMGTLMTCRVDDHDDGVDHKTDQCGSDFVGVFVPYMYRGMARKRGFRAPRSLRLADSVLHARGRSVLRLSLLRFWWLLGPGKTKQTNSYVVPSSSSRRIALLPSRWCAGMMKPVVQDSHLRSFMWRWKPAELLTSSSMCQYFRTSPLPPTPPLDSSHAAQDRRSFFQK